MNTLINRKDREYQENGFLQFSADELAKLTNAEISRIKDHFQGYALMKLPEKEIAFFEWLKINDRPVWDDLWPEAETEYMVSIDLLDHFMHSGNGFPICDLVGEANYWFTARMIKPKGRELFPEIEQKLDGDNKLTFEEALLVEIMQGPIDLWHFCHRYKISIAFAKSRIDQMQQEDLLVHLHDREDLVKYIDF
jgi:hypothetical protein